MTHQKDKKTQLAFWADPELMDALERYREQIEAKVGRKPTRAEITRIAVQKLLGVEAASLSDDANPRAIAQQQRRLAEAKAKNR